MNHEYRKYLYLVLVVLFVAVLYRPVLFNDFTTWDDPLHVTENPTIKSLSIDSLAVHFEPTTRYMYHPLTMISYALDWNVGEGKPFAFHFTNYLFHLINVMLVFFFIQRLSGNSSVALIVSLLFGIHPINVETVAWISARKDILFSFFLLSGINSYVVFKEHQSKTWYLVFVYIFFGLGLLSKPTMVVFPLMLMAIDWLMERPFDKSNIIEKSLLVLVSLLYGSFTYMLSSSDTTGGMGINIYSASQRILLASYSLLFYCVKIAIPLSFSAVYSYPVFSSIREAFWLYSSPVILVSLIIVLIKLKKTQRFVVFGFVWYVLPLLLVTQLLPFHNSSLVADRYAYISSIGILFIIVSAFKKFLHPLINRNAFISFSAGILFTVIVCLLCFSTLSRISVWKDGESLFSDIISKNKNIWLAYANRASERIIKEKYTEAMRDCDIAIAINPYDPKLYYNRGNAKSNLSEYSQAISDYDSAIAKGSTIQYVVYNKGIAYDHLHMIDSAMRYYKATIQKDPSFPNAYYSIGHLLLQEKNDPQEALPYLDTAIVKAGSFTDVYYQRSIANYRLGRYFESLEDCKMVLLLHPEAHVDTLVRDINTGIDSVTTLISKLDDRIEKFPLQNDNFFIRAKCFEILGDSIRAHYDLKSVRYGR
jgi:protein O-mannosyl-transferase